MPVTEAFDRLLDLSWMIWIPEAEKFGVGLFWTLAAIAALFLVFILQEWPNLLILWIGYRFVKFLCSRVNSNNGS